MYKRIFAAALVFGGAATAPPVAEAQLVCGTRDSLVALLEQNYGEVQKGVGLRGGGALYELWASEKGSWTFLLTRPDGITCVVADGQHWTDAPAPERVRGEAS